VKSRTVRLHLLSCSLAPWRTQALDNCSGVDLQQAGGFLLGIPIPGCWQWLEWTPVRPRTPGPWRRACISPRDEIRPFQPGCHVPSKRQKTHSGSRNEKCLSRGGGGRRREIKKKKKGKMPLAAKRANSPINLNLLRIHFTNMQRSWPLLFGRLLSIN